MEKIIQFPTKESFIEKYGANIPDELKDCLMSAYDDVISKSEKLVSLEISVSGKIKSEAFELEVLELEEHRVQLLELLSQLLIEKSNACVLKYKISKLQDIISEST